MGKLFSKPIKRCCGNCYWVSIPPSSYWCDLNSKFVEKDNEKVCDNYDIWEDGER